MKKEQKYSELTGQIIGCAMMVHYPKKDETILDPACGTAGFLISSYKHLLRVNTDAEANSTLTPDEKGKLATNFQGYDISPDMVRLSLVNMYLHGFAAPHIFEYDTLTSEERWNEYADVILANPPFMSPKGGIRPHNRFSVQSKRSEVLFVDYMAEHLTPNGRAGIIVPEGIIFQSQNAYKQLRKMLVEEFLVAVVSLPAGVFQPYSGVKTSVLILDKTLAKRTDRIAFFKVANDGFDLGAQRRPIDKNDLPQVLDQLRMWMKQLRIGNEELGMKGGPALVVEKTKIAANGEYNLSGERYRETFAYPMLKWPLVELRDICIDILSGGTPSTKNESYWNGDIPWITSADIVDIQTAIPRKYITQDAIRESATNLIPKGNIIVVTRVGLGKLFKNDFDVCISQDSQGLIVKEDVNADFLVYVLKNRVANFKNTSQGSTIQGVTKRQLSELQIPLPPLEVQKEIVAEIEGYQKVINGARTVIDNYRPHIPINPDWPLVEVGDVFRRSEETVLPKSLDSPVPYIGLENITQNTGQLSGKIVASSPAEIKSLKNIFHPDDILYGKLRPNLNKVWLADREGICSTDIFVVRPLDDGVLPAFYVHIFRSDRFKDIILSQIRGAQLPRVGWQSFTSTQIPLPPLETQQSIVAEIEAEQALVNANRELIERFEKKIQAAVGPGWEHSEGKANEVKFPRARRDSHV